MSDPTPEPKDLQAQVNRIAAMPRVPAAEPPRLPPAPKDGLTLRRMGQWQEGPFSIPSRFVDADLADFANQTEPTVARLADWAANPRGRNMVIFGPVGVGKTHAAVGACRPAHFDRSQDVAFWPVVEMLIKLRPNGDPTLLDQLMDVDLLILDELCGERPTDWTSEQLHALIGHRWNNERPTLATSNLPASPKVAPEGYTGDTLQDFLGERLFSRLVGSGAVIVKLSGPDRRR